MVQWLRELDGAPAGVGITREREWAGKLVIEVGWPCG